jgi:hypothetical protein
VNISLYNENHSREDGNTAICRSPDYRAYTSGGGQSSAELQLVQLQLNNATCTRLVSKRGRVVRERPLIWFPLIFQCKINKPNCCAQFWLIHQTTWSVPLFCAGGSSCVQCAPLWPSCACTQGHFGDRTPTSIEFLVGISRRLEAVRKFRRIVALVVAGGHIRLLRWPWQPTQRHNSHARFATDYRPNNTGQEDGML